MRPRIIVLGNIHCILRCIVMIDLRRFMWLLTDFISIFIYFIKWRLGMFVGIVGLDVSRQFIRSVCRVLFSFNLGVMLVYDFLFTAFRY